MQHVFIYIFDVMMRVCSLEGRSADFTVLVAFGVEEGADWTVYLVILHELVIYCLVGLVGLL